MPDAAPNNTLSMITGARGLSPSQKPRLDEVTRAKLELLDLCKEQGDSFDLVRRHPLASVGVAFACGLILMKSTTVRTLGRTGLHTGVTTVVSRLLGGLF